MTKQESREIFLDSILTEFQKEKLREQGLYQRYAEGKISVEDIYQQLRDQGV